MRHLIVLFCLLVSSVSMAQMVPYHVSQNQTYEFLEELASLRVIQLNNVTLPLSRKQIADLLENANDERQKLNSRQRADLEFYRQEFIKDRDTITGLDFIGKGLKRGEVFPLHKRAKRYDLFHYKDSLFNITVNSRFGGDGWWSPGNAYYQSVVGATIFGNVSKHFSYFADLTDHRESRQLSDPDYLQQRSGGNYKFGTDYSEMRGGMAASNKWGYLALMKDHLVWGSGYNGANILFGSRPPSVPMIKLHLSPVKWFSFDYVHAWLVSGVVDSAATYNSGNGTREVFRSKFYAANMFTVRPIKGLHISVGNSIVYADKFQPVYLIPFLFFKSADHTLNNTGQNHNQRGQNSQMFMNIVSRQIPYVQLYTSLFADELRLTTMFEPSKARNHMSWKIGFRFTSPGNVNLSLLFEYTRNNPFVYRHFVNTTTYASNDYSMGHYLGDNAEEYHVALIYKPVARFDMIASFTLARKGETYPYTSGQDGTGFKLISSEQFRRYTFNWRATYQVAHDVRVSLGYQYLSETGPAAYSTLPAFRTISPHRLSVGLFIGI
ncbi:MAG: hypothetical protein H6601_05615 [Flavobacteriales bacterium]|nr:hypothetical protein [Flavobacteriales bacterium]